MRRLALALLLVSACAPKSPRSPNSTGGVILIDAAAPARGESIAAAPPTGGAGVALPDGGIVVEPPRERPPNVKITVKATARKMKVWWGRKLLGDTPVQLMRPRDSGPVDLVVKGDGYLPVHVRAYTYNNDTLVVKMTRLEDKMTILGARAEPAPTVDGGAPAGAMPSGGLPDAGVPGVP